MRNVNDPSNFLEVRSIVAKKMTTGLAQDLIDANKIDIGRYEYVMVLASCSDVGTGITVTITPKEGDTQTGPEFPLDGTNGAPNFTITVTGAALGTGWAAFSTSGRRRYLQVAVVTTGGSGDASVSVNVLGFLRSSEPVLRPFTRTGVANIGIT